MFFSTQAKDRPYHLGLFPLETLPHDDRVAQTEAARPRIARPVDTSAPDSPVGRAARKYRDLFAALAEDGHAPRRAPITDDPHRRMVDVKGYAYFLNAAHVGICEIPENAWVEGEAQGTPMGAHGLAVVMLVEHGRPPETDNRAHGWVAPAVREVGDMRAAEIAICIARHIRVMGFAAKAHVASTCGLDMERLAVIAGIAVRDADGQARSPYLDDRFSLAVVATDYDLATDRPLAARALGSKGLGYWLGQNGAESGRERNRRAARPAHFSKYPMEQVKRVDRPTTLILDDEVPRVPLRSGFFERALKGDLGPKAQKERNRFSLKHPTSSALTAPIGRMIPLQEGETNETADKSLYADPAANAKAIKALSYFMGADLTGICEIPHYAWYSHDKEGAVIVPYHRYAVVMLIDQEYDTMEGASGDDWISGVQSMRGYLRGAEIAGVMAESLRELGFSARSHTAPDSHVLQLPLVLWAGLGELSRIGELVLNPFVGPRFKSVVLTTDLPLQVDRPIDFGLQIFCGNCWKCARECPCDAIPWGPKIMFNGYETWKPDVERCARYRLTNPKGSACGRCMKTCPLNKVVTADGPLAQRIASWLGVNAMWLKPLLVPIAVKLDDWLGHGKRNPAKKWWFDLEVVEGICVEPLGVNKRDLDITKFIDAGKQKMAFYPANTMPPPDHMEPFPVNRKEAMAAGAKLETPAQARARAAAGGATPAHYRPTPPKGEKHAAE